MSVYDDMQAKMQRESKPVYVSGNAENYAEAKAYFQKEYGQRGWTSAYVASLGYRNTSVPAKQDKPYQAAMRSIQMYEKGQSLSSKYAQEATRSTIQVPTGERTPTGTITVHIEGMQGQRSRGFDVPFSGVSAYGLVNTNFAETKNFYQVWLQYAVSKGNLKPEWLAQQFEYGSPDSDTDGAIIVTSVS